MSSSPSCPGRPPARPKDLDGTGLPTPRAEISTPQLATEFPFKNAANGLSFFPFIISTEVPLFALQTLHRSPAPRGHSLPDFDLLLICRLNLARFHLVNWVIRPLWPSRAKLSNNKANFKITLNSAFFFIDDTVYFSQDLSDAYHQVPFTTRRFVTIPGGPIGEGGVGGPWSTPSSLTALCFLFLYCAQRSVLHLPWSSGRTPL